MSLWLEKLYVRRQCFQVRHKTLFIENPPNNEMPLAAATSVRAKMCFKNVSGERRFRQLIKSHPRRTHNFQSHSDICFNCNLSGDAADTFLKSCFAERTSSPATAPFLSCTRARRRARRAITSIHVFATLHSMLPFYNCRNQIFVL